MHPSGLPWFLDRIIFLDRLRGVGVQGTSIIVVLFHGSVLMGRRYFCSAWYLSTELFSRSSFNSKWGSWVKSFSGGMLMIPSYIVQPLAIQVMLLREYRLKSRQQPCLRGPLQKSILCSSCLHFDQEQPFCGPYKTLHKVADALATCYHCNAF